MNFNLESIDNANGPASHFSGFGYWLAEMKSGALSKLLKNENKIPFDLTELAQADSSVTALIEQTCIQYPTVQLTGFSK